MKSKEEILSMLYATLNELQNGVKDKVLKNYLETKLQVLVDILGEEIPEEYWEQLDEFVV